MYKIALLTEKKNWKRSAIKAQQILKILVRKATSAMFQNKKLKRNAISAIAEVAEVALCAFNCALPISEGRDGNIAAYAAARCCWCTAPRSVPTKICISSQRQRSAAYYNFYIFFTIIVGELFCYVQQW